MVYGRVCESKNQKNEKTKDLLTATSSSSGSLPSSTRSASVSSLRVSFPSASLSQPSNSNLATHSMHSLSVSGGRLYLGSLKEKSNIGDRYKGLVVLTQHKVT